MELHESATAAYLDNEFASDPIEMENGIRQGRSLASMLLVLAVDSVYQSNPFKFTM